MPKRSDVFEPVRKAALALPDVEEISKNGFPGWKLRGCFLAGIAAHASAEPGSLVVRSGIEDRDLLISDAPDTYYVTDYYQKYPLVLVRLAYVGPDALRDLLSVSWRLTAEKAPKPRKR